jgi:hypothetical protein
MAGVYLPPTTNQKTNTGAEKMTFSFLSFSKISPPLVLSLSTILNVSILAHFVNFVKLKQNDILEL